MKQALSAVQAITLFVADVDRSKAWYAMVFECPIAFEDADSAVFKLDNTLINLLNIAEADDLIGPARVGSANAGTQSQFTFGVDDVDAVYAELVERGVNFTNGPIDRAWGSRTASFADPDGHHWEIAQSIEAEV